METLRILGERSRDGSADIWMFAISICCLWDLFLRQCRGNRGRVPGGKNPLVSLDTFCTFLRRDGFFISCLCLNATWTASEKRIHLMNFSQRPKFWLLYTETFCTCHKHRWEYSSFTHSYVALHTCTCLWCIIIICMLVICYKDIVCGHDNDKCMFKYVFRSKHAVPSWLPYNEFLLLWIMFCFFLFFPVASCSSGSWTGLCSSNTTEHIKFFMLDFKLQTEEHVLS